MTRPVRVTLKYNKSKVNTFHWYSIVAVLVWPILAFVVFSDLPNVKWLNVVPGANTDVLDFMSSLGM